MKCRCGKTMDVEESKAACGNNKYTYKCAYCRSIKVTFVKEEDRKRGGDVQRGAGQRVLKEY